MKKTAMLRKLMAALMALAMLVTIIPARAANGGTEVTMTPFQQFCGAYINLGGTNYLCAVDLGAPIIDSASDAVLTAGSTIRFELFFSINDGWYACRKQEMQGDPNSLFTVRVNKTVGGDRFSEPVWKTYPDDGYGERYYLELTVLGGETDAPVDISVALTQPDVPNVGADYRIKGTSAAYGTCTADFNLPGYSGPCDVYFGDPVTSTGDPAAMVPGSMVCFPLMFMGGDGQLYAAFNTELQGDPNTLFELEASTDALLTNSGWKTWDNGHWYLEYTVGQGNPGDTMTQQVRLRQKAAYKATPWKGVALTMAQKDLCVVPISIGGTVYDCTVDLGGYILGADSAQNMVANSTVCFPLMFMGGDGQWYPVLAGELQGNPAALLTVAETITSGGMLLTNTGWKTWENGHYYLEYTVADSQYETDLQIAVQLKQDVLYRQGTVQTFAGKAPASSNPMWRMCVAPISIGGTVYDCVVDLRGYLTSTGSDTLAGGGSVCFPLMFQGGDGQWYPVLSGELQGNPDSLFEAQETIVSGGALLRKIGWGTWENGHYYLEYAVADAEFETAVDFSVKLIQSATGKYGDAVRFVGIVSASENPFWDHCHAEISIGGTVYTCAVDLQGYLTSTGDTQNMTAGSTVCFPLMFLGGDGNWYAVLSNELQGDPSELFAVEKSVVSGGALLNQSGWKTWENGHYYLEYTVADSEFETVLDFSVLLQHADGSRSGVAARFEGKAPASDNPYWKTCRVPISIGGTVYECIVDLQGYLTSSGSDELENGGTIAFPLMFQGSDGVWYPVLKNELQGDPAELLSVAYTANVEDTQLQFNGWGNWDSGHYFAEFKVASAKEKTDLNLTATLQRDADHSGVPVTFTGSIAALPVQIGGPCYVPIKIGDTVYDCIVDLQGYLTSSGSNTLTGGGTVAFPLMFMGGDGVWYPVLKNELQGNPADFLSGVASVTSGGDLLTQTGWGCWDNGHYYLEYRVASAKVDTNVAFAVQLRQNGGKAGSWDSFSGTVSGTGAGTEDGTGGETGGTDNQCYVPIQIEGTVYDCIVDLQGSLTSSGSATLEGGGTVAFPLMFLGGDGVWYPVLKDELQGDPAELLSHELNALSGEELLEYTGWGYWENGHYYLEYKVKAPKETTELNFGVTLVCGENKGVEDLFSGYAQPGPDISSQQIPLKPSASLVVERIEECLEFNTMSFTIAGVRYNDGWPIDFESPNTTSAVITDGTIIRADLCFKVNGQWYPVRQQECNESVEDLFTYDFQVLSGDDFLGAPRFTTRYDAYGDIWQFEVGVNSEEEGEFSFTLQLVAKDGSRTGSKYKVTGRVQNGEMTSTVEELPEENGGNWLWLAIGGGAPAVILIALILIMGKKKAKKQ